MRLLAIAVLASAPALLAACKDDQPAGGAAAMASAAAAKWAASSSASVAPPPVEKPHDRTVLAHLHQPKALAQAGAFLFVSDSVGGDKDKGTELLDLVRISSKSEDPKTELRLLQKQRGLGSPLVVQDQIYFTVASERPGDDRLVKMSVNGGAMTTLATKVIGAADPAIATDGTSLYVLGVPDGASAASDAGPSKMDVLRVPLGGGKVEHLATTDRSARLLFVAADAHDVYFPQAGRIARVPVGGGEVVDVAKVVYAWAAASDGQSLFFTDSPGENMGTVRRAPVGPGAPPLGTLSSGFSFPVAVTLSQRAVFFVNFDAQDGGVFRVAKAGGNAVPLVQGQKHPSHVLFDGVFVYWTNTAEGTVCRTEP